LKATFCVCCHIVYGALCWLKMHNTLYADVNISMERLASLPEDGVPDEIMTNIRHEPNGQLAERERETYVPGIEAAIEGSEFIVESTRDVDDDDDPMDVDNEIGLICDVLVTITC
jgi:hypothetical protein